MGQKIVLNCPFTLQPSECARSVSGERDSRSETGMRGERNASGKRIMRGERGDRGAKPVKGLSPFAISP